MLRSRKTCSSWLPRQNCFRSEVVKNCNPLWKASSATPLVKQLMWLVLFLVCAAGLTCVPSLTTNRLLGSTVRRPSAVSITLGTTSAAAACSHTSYPTNYRPRITTACYAFGSGSAETVVGKVVGNANPTIGWDLYGRVPYDDSLFSTHKLISKDLLKRSFVEAVRGFGTGR
jgi:hypothetical protein